jgi:DNA-binding response OmpR family regulator
MAIRSKVRKVLVVDDNEQMAKCLADMVSFFSASCDTASDGKEAMQRLEENSYSLVIADTHMPNVSGFKLLKHIRKNHPGLPVALISTRNSQMTQGMVVTNGPDFYLPKPFKSSDIRDLLDQLK